MKQAYAVARGIPLRTAQDRAKKDHPDYVAFRATMGVQGVKAAAPSLPQKQALLSVMQQGGGPMEAAGQRVEPHVAPPAMSTPRHLWTPEQYAECETWLAMTEANAQRIAALARGDAMAALAFCKVAAECLRAYHMARAKRVQSDLEAGRLKPMSAWQAMKTGVLKIAALLAGLEGELAQAANPGDPLFARKKIGDWKEQKWNPAVRSVIEELDAALTV